LLAYERVLDDERAIVAFNASDTPHDIVIPADGGYRLVYPVEGDVAVTDGTLGAHLPARSARVWVQD
jgi:hypothetical protein